MSVRSVDDEISPDDVEVFEGLRARLGAIAYRLLGSASEAEDVVQETFLRWQTADREQVRVPAAWLTRVLTNLCLTQLQSARARREVYVGQWLPEPLLKGDPMLGPADTAEQRESVSTAVLVLMERLTPTERAVYVLREAFSYSHADIADVLDLTETTSQQVLHRAKEHLATERVRTEVDRAAARKVVEEFFAAAMSGQTEPLVRLLTDDATGIGDGGGKMPARSRVVVGAQAVAQLFRGLLQPSDAKRRLIGGSPEAYAAVVNGGPALLVAVGDRVVGIVTLETTADGISALLSQANPDKLERASRQWARSDHGEPLPTTW